jgi:hypothetical protein
LLQDSSDESDDDNEVDAAADVVAVADVVEKDHDENTRDDASDLEPEPTVPKASTTKKVAVPKTSKKRGPRGHYKKKSNNSFFTLFFTIKLLCQNYFSISSIIKFIINASTFHWFFVNWLN